MKTGISVDTADAVGWHDDELEDDAVVLPAADCTLPTTPSYTQMCEFTSNTIKI